MEFVFSNNLPIYIQIVNILKKEIISGVIAPGDKLPSVRELALRFKVNPNTVQRVFSELENSNLTYTKRGMGTFLKENMDMINDLKSQMARDTLKKFIKDMTDLGFSLEEILSSLKNIKEDTLINE